MKSLLLNQKPCCTVCRAMNFLRIHIHKIYIVFFLFCAVILNAAASSGKIDFREEMRKFVISISEYAKSFNPDFIVIPQNGLELLTNNGTSSGIPHKNYFNAISAVGCESLFYSYTADNKSASYDEKQKLLSLCRLSVKSGKAVLVTDYCSNKDKVDLSYSQNEKERFISFAANTKNLSSIPKYPVIPHNSNYDRVNSIYNAKNFLYLLNPEKYSSKEEFIKALCKTNYDVFIIDLFHFGKILHKSDLNKLKTKQNGKRRLVICYMSIGEAEDYRYYWNKICTCKPDWLKAENPAWKGNYIVEYWNKDWQKIITGNSNSYLYKIISTGFDGVYLDIIDAFEYFE